MSSLSKKTSKSKEELVKENDMLRDKIKKLLNGDGLKQQDTSDLNKVAASFICEDGIYKIVKVMYNRDTGMGRVVEVLEAGKLPKDFYMSNSEFQKFVHENIIFKL